MEKMSYNRKIISLGAELILADKSYEGVIENLSDNEKRLHSALGYYPPNEYESLVAKNNNRNRQTLLTPEILCV